MTNFQIKPLGVFGFDLTVNLFWIAGRLLFQDRGEGGAGVFGVDVDTASENCLMADVTAGKVEAAFDHKMSFVFDLLRDDFTKDELLGEILGADDDSAFTRRTAGREQRDKRERENRAGQMHGSFAALRMTMFIT